MKLPMCPETTDQAVLDSCYKDRNLHTLYYAEVLACYEIL